MEEIIVDPSVEHVKPVLHETDTNDTVIVTTLNPEDGDSGEVSQSSGSEVTARKESTGNPTDDAVSTDIEHSNIVDVHAPIQETTGHILLIDKLIWRYIMASLKHSSNVSLIETDCSVRFRIIDDNHLQVDGDSEKGIQDAMDPMRRIIEDCQKFVSTITLPAQSEETTGKIREHFNPSDLKISEGCLVSFTSEDEQSLIRLTGTEKERALCLGMMQELFAVLTDEEIVNEEQVTVDSSGGSQATSTLKLWDKSSSGEDGEGLDNNDDKNDEENDDDIEGKNVLIVLENLWRYMEKTPSWVEALQAKRPDGITLEVTDMEEEDESEVYAKRLRLTFSGPDEEAVCLARDETKKITKVCTNEVTTYRAPCTDHALYSKISKLLKHMNKSPCHISASSASFYMTGSAAEIKPNMEKLKSYGLIFEIPGEPGSYRPQPVAAAATPASATGEATTASTAPFSTATDHGTAPGRDYVPYPIFETDGTETTAVIEVEALLWTYIQTKRRSAIQELKDGFGIDIIVNESSRRAPAIPATGGAPVLGDSDVLLTLTAASHEMLDSGRLGLYQLIEQLQLHIVVEILPFQMQGQQGGPAIEFPPQLVQMIQEQCGDEEAVIECTPQGIRIIAPTTVAAECKQKVMAFLVQLGEAAQGQGGAPGRQQFMSGMGRGGLAGMMGGGGGMFGGAGGLEGMLSGGGGLGRGGLAGMMAGGGGAGLFGGAGRGGGFSLGGVFPGNARPGSGGVTITELPADSEEAGAGAGAAAATRRPITTTIGPKPPPPVQSESSVTTTIGPKPPAPKVAETSSVLKSGDNRGKSSGHSVRFADEQESRAGKTSCSLCSGAGLDGSATPADSSEACKHTYCLSCVEIYFKDSDSYECPLCGPSEVSKIPATQPCDGKMFVTTNDSLHLPGFEKSSNGTIIICYAFPAGEQTDDLPNPGKPYQGLTRTAYLPSNSEGDKIARLLQKAFDYRLLFTFNSDGELTFGSVLHKVNIYGGPKQMGYPDPVYLRRVQTDLKRIHCIVP